MIKSSQWSETTGFSLQSTHRSSGTQAHMGSAGLLKPGSFLLCLIAWWWWWRLIVFSHHFILPLICAGVHVVLAASPTRVPLSSRACHLACSSVWASISARSFSVGPVAARSSCLSLRFLVACSLASIDFNSSSLFRRRTSSVMACDKACDDCNEVVVCSVVISFRVAVNHDFCTVKGEDLLKTLEADTGKAVPVQDHNTLDTALADLLQKGPKSFPFKVDTAPDVGDDSVVGRVELSQDC
mmetsp:Transcript_17769/g.50877  ORF Transcript_17769/g.50877 Transcript_17769/m.50877 type:complete len:241 (-) Transcript_17769:358-1080(-)